MGKTAALRSLSGALNPHRYMVLYQAETDFGRVDIYRGLARALGVEPSYRRAQLWRDIKQRVHELVDTRQRGGSANLHTAISGNSATTRRA